MTKRAETMARETLESLWDLAYETGRRTGPDEAERERSREETARAARGIHVDAAIRQAAKYAEESP